MEKPMKILVVDDSPDTHEMVELLFGASGRPGVHSAIVHAENGRDGLKQLTAHPDLDVVILDLTMPVMDGFAFLEQVRNGRFASIPVCVFTGNQEEASKALGLGARDFVRKPGDYQELRLRIINLVDQKRRAQASERAKIDFLAVVGHELRTPMNGIVGMAQAIRDDGLTPQQSDYLDALETSSRRMMVLINNVLNFLESDNPLLGVPRISFGLRETLAAVLEVYAETARRNGIDAEVLVEPAVPDRLIGLPDKLRLILDQLVGNAVKFSPGGKVVIGVDIESHGESEVYLVFSVQDTGIGLPAEDQERILEPFTQQDGSVTRSFGGLGLGLSIAHRTIQMLGGFLEVQSKPGRGSTFRFTCPFKEDPSLSCSPSTARR
jgi:signal transduction histidine kinase